jgi:hypothetical protein
MTKKTELRKQSDMSLGGWQFKLKDIANQFYHLEELQENNPVKQHIAQFIDSDDELIAAESGKKHRGSPIPSDKA